jgi:hypothetical protein
MNGSETRTACNLDYEAAKTASDIIQNTKTVGTLERVSTKAIGVMQSQGIYGLFLYLDSRKSNEEKKDAKLIWKKLAELAASILKIENEKIALKIVENREHQMLIFELFERTLTYIRFSAKAKEG